jgi:tetratricopeptide (TPR) repeat protein
MVRLVAGAAEDPGATLPADAEDRDAQPWPVTIDRFRVEGVLGIGGMGVVLSAHDPELHRKVAIKLVATGGAADAQARLLREARAAAQLSHAHVVAVHDVGVIGDRVWVAMERVDGEDLAAWLERPRALGAVLDVFAQAGRGLAAAHRAGIVHRDFKPANVLVGRDGQVRVADFGLARLTSSADQAASAAGDLGALATETGGLVGTPAFMAPEQLAGEPVTPASDQFAFCVALYRALTEQSPFVGDDVVARLAAMDAERVQPWPRANRVPGWLRGLIERGLRRAPRARFASMDELLVALARGRRRRARRGLVITAGAGVMIAATAVWTLARAPAGEACRGLDSHLTGVWDDARRDGVRAAFAASRRSFGPALADRVIAQLDEHAAGWTRLRVEVCEATRVRGEQSEVLLDAKNLCLDRRLGELGALAALLASPSSPTVIDEALAAAQQLPPVAACGQSERLAALVPLPADAEDRGKIAAVEAELARTRATTAAGDAAAAMAGTRAALASAEGLGYAPLLASALRALAELELHLGALADADLHLARGLETAVAARDADAEAAIWVLMVKLRAAQKRPREAIALRPAADVALGRAGASVALRIDLLRALALAYRVDTDYVQQRAVLEQALLLAERSHGPDHLTTADVICQLAPAFDDQRERQMALVFAERCLAMRQRALGERHPDVGRAWHVLGIVQNGLKRRPEAEASATRGIEILEETMGPDYPELANFYANRSMPQRRLKKFQEALASAERALAIDRKTHGKDHVNVGLSAQQVAHLLRDLERYDEALVHYREARENFSRLLDPEHPYVGSAFAAMGETYERMARFDDAIAMQERAFEIASKRPEHCTQPFMARITLAEPLVMRGRKGDRARAMALLYAARDGLVACPNAAAELEKLQIMLDSHHLRL